MLMWPVDNWDFGTLVLYNSCLRSFQVIILPVYCLFLDATVDYSVPPGFGGILLDNLACRGTETRLLDCPHNGLNIHDCIHPHDIGIRCLPSPTREWCIAIVAITDWCENFDDAH